MSCHHGKVRYCSNIFDIVSQCAICGNRHLAGARDSQDIDVSTSFWCMAWRNLDAIVDISLPIVETSILKLRLHVVSRPWTDWCRCCHSVVRPTRFAMVSVQHSVSVPSSPASGGESCLTISILSAHSQAEILTVYSLNTGTCLRYRLDPKRIVAQLICRASDEVQSLAIVFPIRIWPDGCGVTTAVRSHWSHSYS